MKTQLLSLEEAQLRKTADLLYSSRKSVRDVAKAELIAAGEAVIPFLLNIVAGKEIDRLIANYDEMHEIPNVHLSGEWVRWEAAEVLAQIGGAALPYLIELLEHKEEKFREAAIRALCLEGVTDQVTPLILPLLKHKVYHVREAAAKVLSISETPQVLDGFAEVLVSEGKKRYRQRQKARRWAIALVSLYVLGFVISIATYGQGWGSYIRVGLHSIQIFGFLFAVKGMSSLSKEAIRTIQGKFDVQMIGMLVMCLPEADAETRDIVVQELKRLLAEVKIHDRQYLNNEEMKILLAQLDGKDEEFTIAILKALEQIGDERALPYVERLAQKADPKRRKTVKEILLTPIGSKKPDTSEFVTVSEAAKACLPFLHQRIQEAAVSSTLLRASSQHEVSGSEELLRPASASQERHEAELLRATNG